MFVQLFDYVVNWSDDPLGKAHVYFAIFALLLGPVLFLSPKGTTRHKTLGLAYFVSMLSINVSALMKYDLTGHFNLFHIAAIFSLMTVTPGYIAILCAIKTRQVKYIVLHSRLMAWSYFGLIMALVAEVVTRTVPYLLHGEGGWTRFTVALSCFMFFTSILSHRLINRGVSRWYNNYN